MSTHNRGIMLLALFIASAVAVAANSSPVLADPCSAQASYSVTTTSYYNSNVGLVVSVSARCSFTDGRLYAVGHAYDRSTTTDLGSVSTGLISIYGDNAYTGQFVFNLSPGVAGHMLQISTSIYSGRFYMSLLTTTADTVRLYSSNYYPNCEYYGCSNLGPGYYFNGNYYTTCQSTGNSSMVQCSGYLYQPSSGCIELAIPIDNGYWFESRVYQYYTLQNLPSSYTPSSGWVTVTGQLYQGYNFVPSGASCPGNYIVVNSISP